VPTGRSSIGFVKKPVLASNFSGSGASNSVEGRWFWRDGIWTGREAWQEQLAEWELTNELTAVSSSEAALFGKLLTEKWVRKLRVG